MLCYQSETKYFEMARYDIKRYIKDLQTIRVES